MIGGAVPELANCPGDVRVTVPVLEAKRPSAPRYPPECVQLPPPQLPTWPLLNSPRDV